MYLVRFIMLYIVLDDEVFQKKDDESFNISSSSHLFSLKIYKFGTHGYTAPKYVQTCHVLLKRDL